MYSTTYDDVCVSSGGNPIQSSLSLTIFLKMSLIHTVRTKGILFLVNKIFQCATVEFPQFALLLRTLRTNISDIFFGVCFGDILTIQKTKIMGAS